MARISINKSILLLFSGAAAAICFAGPLAGAARGLFWPYIAGGHTEGAAARRILEGEYWRTYQSGDLVHDTSRAEGECQTRFDRQMLELTDKAPQKADVLGNLRFPFFAEQMRREAAAKEDPKLKKLARLPFSALGAIEGCLEQSALAPLCRMYVRQVLNRPDIQIERAYADEHADEDQHMEDVWCAVAASSIVNTRS
jgi:hypothetical protein